MQQEIQNAAYEYQQQVDREEAVVVGVNRFAVEEEKPIPIQRIDEVAGAQAGGASARVARPPRFAARGRESLRQIEDAARSGANLMPHILAAVEAYATVGEISDTHEKGVRRIQRSGCYLNLSFCESAISGTAWKSAASAVSLKPSAILLASRGRSLDRNRYVAVVVAFLIGLAVVRILSDLQGHCPGIRRTLPRCRGD